MIKVESFHKPDGSRTTTRKPGDPRWWNHSGLYHPNNQGKRSIGIDLNTEAGRAIARRLIESADVVIENFTPRVMEQFGFDWDAVHAINPRAVMVRMPAFGLDGEWRDRPGFATTMEQLAGMCWTTGYPDGPPVNPGGVGDPIAGTHAVLATLVALDQRDRTGAGVMVEAPLIEPALNVAAEAIIEAGAYGTVLERMGNRGRTAAPQNIYPAAGVDQWVALAVETDEHWRALVSVLGDPAWASDERFATAFGRREHHDELDVHLGPWTETRNAHEAAELLVAAGVPAAPVIHAREIVSNPQMQARGLYQHVEHPEAGPMWVPSVAIRFASQKYPWPLAHGPSLGEHTNEVLAELGYSDAEIADLWATAAVSDMLAS